MTELHRHDHSKILATYVRTPLTWGVHVHSSAGYRDVDSLHRAEGGARFAVSRMGSGSHLMAAVDARSRGVDPAHLQYEVVGSLQGARQALAEGQAAAPNPNPNPKPKPNPNPNPYPNPNPNLHTPGVG